MKVFGLDGKEQHWIIRGKTKVGNYKSKYHYTAYEVLHNTYPTAQILNEVTIPIRLKQNLYLDFYIPLYKIAIEVHGEQHFKYVPHFHKTKLQFVQSKKRDREKKEWCILNNIKLIIFQYNENINEWYNKLQYTTHGCSTTGIR